MLVLLSLLAACAPDDRTAQIGCDDCALTDANQFAYEAELDVATSAIAPGVDVGLSWGELEHDILGRTLDPVEDINAASLVAFRNLSQAEVVASLQADDLKMVDVAGVVSCVPTDAACSLSDFGLGGNSAGVEQFFMPNGIVWMLALQSQGESGARALLFLEPTADSAVENYGLTEADSHLSFAVNFESLEPLVVAPNRADLRMDWSAVEQDGLGNTLQAPSISELFLGRFAGELSDVAGGMVDLEANALESWTMALDGSTHADLSNLIGETPFIGVSSEDTWVLALRCLNCMNGAPRLVTVLSAGAH